MGTQTPLVLEAISLPEFIRYILKNHAAPSTVIICSAREIFMQQLHDAVATEIIEQDEGVQPQHTWTTPTLRLLASSRSVQLAFCPDLPHLRTVLAAYASRSKPDHTEYVVSLPPHRTTRTLAILNPIQLHRPTSAYSAQGLNRTFASAVEAAHHTSSRLVMVECAPSHHNTLSDDPSMGFEREPMLLVASVSNPWDEEISLLNVTTKSFGAGERGWVGRTVKARTVAERWCVFEDMSSSATAS